ncbi:zinc-dependent metalloprotease [Spirulina sp. 06S082]|uniref:zinc-dependent metalloprotease n=1 Tax=Spirulina sp. 06S082 TaxID=3110248 RepID=UPI002B21AABB|nr:zinc-dependent metalloprotease [Spirulina sp. 06S082]MEA5471183.1 zinc-dependent metalloprotease [Spirulina sp. 06S082]
MKQRRFLAWFVLGLCLCWGLVAIAPISPIIASPPQQITPKASQKFAEIIEDTRPSQGLFTLYQGSRKLYLEVRPDQLNKNYLFTATLASGLGEGSLINGLQQDSFLFRFQKVENKLHFVLPNLNFRADPNDPQQRNLDRDFSDSVLYALPIKSIDPETKSILVDLKDLLLGEEDLAGLAQLFGNFYSLDGNKSYFESSKVFPGNMEIQVVYGFTALPGRRPPYIASLPDSRAFNLAVHYSIAEIPTNNGYVPRLADDRVGYFLTAYKDISDNTSKEGFVRYIHRWHLEPSDPNATLSPPKEPIIFWIENTVPAEYRNAIREGVLSWNKAFESAGFQDAIQVRQMGDRATWDPEDIRYNVIRWSSTAGGGVNGIGPVQVNPLTGEILASDIVINADVVRRKVEQYENFTGLNQLGAIASICPEELVLPLTSETEPEAESFLSILLANQPADRTQEICFNSGAQEQLEMGNLAISLLQNTVPSPEQRAEYINQYLHSLVAHEIGHGLGLRHNFHGSTLLKPEELHNREITRTKGLVSSVMDYAGVNLAPDGVQQGDYFPLVVGPYDRWAIAYGYKPSGALIPVSERRFLEEIARKSPQPELAYATDEDVRGLQDPNVNRWDLSADVLLHSRSQMDNALKMWDKLQKRYPVQGDRYSEMREKFNEVLNYYFRQARFVTNYIGGRSFNRDRPGFSQGRLPFEQVPLEKQREALQILQEYVFAKDALVFPPELLNQLASSRWSHWGHPANSNIDYPIHDYILFFQGRILRSLLSEERLSNLRDLELKTGENEALTLPELYDTLAAGIWSEILDPKTAMDISSVRRSLQREHLNILIAMVLGRTQVPEDARTLAWYQLRQLSDRLDAAIDRNLETYTRAHLEETRDRIAKTLDARYQRDS